MDDSKRQLLTRVQRRVGGERVVDVIPGSYWTGVLPGYDDRPIRQVECFAVLEADLLGTGIPTRRVVPVFVETEDRLFVDAGCSSVILSVLDDSDGAVEDELFDVLRSVRRRLREPDAMRGRGR